MPRDARTGPPPLAMESPPGPEILLGGTRHLYFGGTAYHALQGHPAVVAAAKAALDVLGMGPATGGTWPVGPGPAQRRLEAKAALFFATEDAVCFASGYLASPVGVAGLSDRIHRVFVDETAHYSVLDGARLSGRPVTTFAHRDPEDLERRLADELRRDEVPLVATDGVFPTRGELAPIPDYVELLEPRNGLLWIDDAHGVGVLGPHGRGTLDHYGVTSERCFFSGSLAKALGGHGGVIPGTRELCGHLRGTSAILRGASGISAPAAAAAAEGMDILLREPERRERLRESSRVLRRRLRQLGLEVSDSPHPVAAFSLGSEEMNVQVQRELMERGIVVPYSKYVGAGEDGVLRVVLFSTHTIEQVTRLTDALREIVPPSHRTEETR